jgi:hypothetical protein
MPDTPTRPAREVDGAGGHVDGGPAPPAQRGRATDPGVERAAKRARVIAVVCLDRAHHPNVARQLRGAPVTAQNRNRGTKLTKHDIDRRVCGEASFRVHLPFGREPYGAGVDLTLIVVVVVVTALAFDFTNGFHDTANAMATSIATGALKPRTAVLIAGVLNLVGAFLSIQVAKTISSGLVDEAKITPTVIFAGLCGAIL